MDVLDFVANWTASSAAERANKDSFLNDLCDVLGVARPNPTTGDPERDAYVFEADAFAIHEGGKTSIRKIDLLKRGCFILEAKQGSDAGSAKIGTARRDTPLWTLAMQSARGQAQGYARTLDEPPPFLITADIGYCFDLFACFDGTADYQPFPNAQGSRIFVRDLERHLDTLRTIFTEPLSLDPSRYSAKVTREIAAHLADLARGLEEAGHPQEGIAKFLMRCLFTMFAEDVGLLPEHVFAKALEKEWIPDPKKFKPQVESLWRIMNDGGEAFTLGKVMRFNGGLFAQPDALTLTKSQLKTLHTAARCRWEDVEPAIFGTLLERALDPKERHRLGAHYTPRAYVERLVRPTIEEPLRADWDVIQAEVRQLVTQDKVVDAQKVVREFHEKLCHVRVLDPACGTGNFLYVTLDVFKRIESEVNELLHGLGSQESLQTTRLSVTPEQFLGIEVKPWAREIAELVLWIGFLQWEFRTRGKTSVPEEPILKDYGNIQCRDAVLAWDSIEPVLDEDGRPVTRWDGETMKLHPATGEDVPDDSARVPVVKYVNPRRAEWPAADFIVGNPPFLGKVHMLDAFGEGYVEALREAYSGDVPDSADFVMYWWYNAATLVGRGAVRRFGLVTTNSITQAFNRRVVTAAIEAQSRIRLAWAIDDHPWVESADGAAVRIAMTVGAGGEGEGVLVHVASEGTLTSEAVPTVTLLLSRGVINADLTIGADTINTVPLEANRSLASMGPALGSRGFVVSASERERFVALDGEAARRVLRPLRNGKDYVAKLRGVFAIDLHGMSEDDVRRGLPHLYQHLRDTVWPERAENKDLKLRSQWWLFRRSNELHRAMLSGLTRFVVTVETAKHRVFFFEDATVLAEHGTISIGIEDASFLAILSSRIHVKWALATGGTLEDRPRYNKTLCFDPFPLPDPTPDQRALIRSLGEALDAHRKRQQSLHPDLTITGMYNVLEKLRSGEALTPKEKIIHEHGLVGTLQKIHDDLDAAVFEAYDWPRTLTDEQILERLVKLNADRAEEERRGIIRWLRPEYQAPKEAQPVQAKFASDDADDDGTPARKPKAKPEGAQPWPASLAERIAAVRDLVLRSSRPWTTEDVAKSFKRAKRTDIEAVLESLAALGLVLAYDLPDGRRWRTPSRTAA